MKRVRITWAIICAVFDIALVVLVCIQWAKTGSPWWSLLLASINYTVGAITVWWTVDDVLLDAQEREEGDIYYKEERYD